MAQKNIRAAVFDFDMTLVDSSYGIHYCTNKLAEHFGLREVSHAEVLHTIGYMIEDAWTYLWGGYDAEWLDYYRDNFRGEEDKRLRVFPNTVSLLEGLKSRGVKVAVASNRRYAKRPLDFLGLTKYFDAVVGLEEVENCKPAPDVLLRALEDIDVSAPDAVYIGDTDIDMQTAAAAKVRGVGMTTGNFDRRGLEDAGAWKVFGDLGKVIQLAE